MMVNIESGYFYFRNCEKVQREIPTIAENSNYNCALISSVKYATKTTRNLLEIRK